MKWIASLLARLFSPSSPPPAPLPPLPSSGAAATDFERALKAADDALDALARELNALDAELGGLDAHTWARLLAPAERERERIRDQIRCA